MVSGIEFVHDDDLILESESWLEDIYDNVEESTGLKVLDLEGKASNYVIEAVQRARLHAAMNGADEVLQILTEWLEVAKQAPPTTVCHVI